MTTASAPIRTETCETEEASTYSPVPVSTLLCGNVLPFAVFTTIGESYIVYRDSNLRFEQIHKETLSERGIHTLYVRGADIEMYHAHVQQNILRLLHGTEIGVEESVVRFYETAKVATRRFISDPASPKSGAAARQVVGASVRRLEEEESLLGYLSRIMEPYPDLYAHSLHTCLYGLALARLAGIDDREEMSDLGVGLLLHDVGKLRLPLEQFATPDPLTAAQWEIMRRHPELGFESVAANALVGSIARDVILNHHERLDGGGYPRGKQGPDLSVHARIAAIANTFDRRTCRCSYRAAAAGADILRAMIVGGRGHFDSRLLATFVRLMAG